MRHLILRIKISSYIRKTKILLMKILSFFLFVIIFTFQSQSQSWLDSDCEIDDKITLSDYSSAKVNNILSLIINQEGKLLMNGQLKEGLSEIQFKEELYDFITNPDRKKTKANSTQKAIIAMGKYGEHDTYNLIMKYVREVYLYAWDKTSQEEYDEIYANLNCRKRKKIRNKSLPYNVFELVQKQDNENKINRGPSIPEFGGDATDY